MPRRYITSLDPWQAEQDELDRLYEHEAPGDRPLWPPSPEPDRSAWGEHQHATVAAHDSSEAAVALVPHTTTMPE